jgi:PAS domain S-box-containing protein
VNVSDQLLSFSLQRFLELLPDAVIVSDMKGETVFINSAAENILELKSDKIKGQNVIEVLPFPTQKFLAMEILNKLKKGGSITEEISFLTPSRKQFLKTIPKESIMKKCFIFSTKQEKSWH